MIRFACPGCSATFTVGDEKAGKTGKCPKCQSQFVIPAADAGAPPTDAPPVPTAGKPASRPSAPPLPPPAADPTAPVEIAPCPKCGSRLSVLPTDVGLDIECPSCETVFTALRADAPPPPDAGGKGKGKGSSALAKLGSGSNRDDDEDDDDRPSKKTSKRSEDDDDDRPSKKKSSRRDDDDEDEDERPSKRKSRRGDDEDEDERPSRRSSSRSKRGGGGSTESKKMTAGLLGLFLGSLGVHKFYLGYTSAGIIQIVVTIFTCGFGGWIGIIEGIIYLTKTDKDFIDTYQRGEKQWF